METNMQKTIPMQVVLNLRPVDRSKLWQILQSYLSAGSKVPMAIPT